MNQENPNQSNEFDLIVKSLEESYSERTYQNLIKKRLFLRKIIIKSLNH